MSRCRSTCSYDAKLNTVFAASNDPDFNVIFPLKKGKKPDRVARATLAKYGTMPNGA
jgi:hypothetical protein